MTLSTTPTNNFLLRPIATLGESDGIVGAEISAYDAATRQLFVTSGSGIQVIDLTDPSNPVFDEVIDLTAAPYNGISNDVSSVTAANGIVAVSLLNPNKLQPGEVIIADADTGDLLHRVTVGNHPDAVTFTPDGTRILVANEGERTFDEDAPPAANNIDAPGSISIIDVATGAVTPVTFTQFNGFEQDLRDSGVRITPNVSAELDFEPEYISVSPDGSHALVTLQENNAVAVLDLTTNTITDVVSLGLQDYSGLFADFSDRDSGINLTTGNPVFGIRMPDAIASYESNGQTYYVIANEGDDRNDPLEFAGLDGEAIRLGDLDLDDTLFPNEAELLANEALGRVNVSNVANGEGLGGALNGDTDGDGDIDQILTYGARSFSILDSNGNVVFDSGDVIERVMAATPGDFDDGTSLDDGRSDNKGPEPEGITVGVVDGRTYAFVAIERGQGGVMTFDVTDPANVSFNGYTTNEGDISPEGLAFINASDSPNGDDLLVVSNEVSNTVTVYQVEETFRLELLHVTDQEATGATLQDIPRVSAILNALRAQDVGEDATLTLSSGDAFIPGLFYDASEAVFGSGGIADIQIQNEMGFQAIAFGNHEFDFGTAELAGLISGDAAGDFSALVGSNLEGLDFTGTDFPYLSTNLDFSTDANLAPLQTAGGQAPMGNVVTSSIMIEEGGELIGVVGATTPTLDRISSPGDVGISPHAFDTAPTPEQIDALAAEIQAEVDALLAANPDMNKVILLAHMQQIGIEFELASRLENVDIIVAGGSNTRLFDENDRVRDGDTNQGEYPTFIENAGGTMTAVVNTDGSYQYVGRLVLDFDAQGNIIPTSYDPEVSGAYAADDQGVADLGAEGLVDPEVQAIVDAIEDQIIATEGNVFGISDVFLNGNRNGNSDPDNPDGVRSQETNLGNLTADANLAYAQAIDDTVVVSIKNGGGIRASIGETIVPPGGTEAVRVPNSAVFDADGNEVKPEGGISQNDIQSTLAFNNGLTLLTLTRAELVAVIEHAVANIGGGQFGQFSGIEFSFDPDQPANDRVQNAAIVDADGNVLHELVRNGEISGNPDETFRIVTLNFMAGGGDGYPFPTGSEANRVDLYDLDADGNPDEATTGGATFAFDGTEQDAFAEYLLANFSETPFSEADEGRNEDGRVQNLAFRDDAVFDDATGPIMGTDDADAIAGTAGDDTIDAKAGDDAVSGLDGNDFIAGGAGNDTIDGGDGFDGADYTGAASGVEVNMNASFAANDGDGGSDLLLNMEGAVGSAHNDELYGSETAPVALYGDGGDDVVFGYAAPMIDTGDTLSGGDGDDVVAAFGGSAFVEGGDGNDALLTSYGANTVDAGAGDDTVYVRYGSNDIDLGEGTNVLISYDLFETTPADNFADSADNVMGGSGQDFIYAGRGEDTIDGGAGDDWLAGGEWADVLTGGAGFDRFIFGDELGFDTITDFTDGEDFLDFTGNAAVSGFSDLFLFQDGADVAISWNGGTAGVVLSNASIANISDADLLV